MKNLFTLLCFAVAIGCGTMARGQGMSAANPVELSKKINEASILFVENRGQIVGPNGEARPDILFSAKGQGCKVFVTSTGLSYQFLHIENEAETNESQKSDNYRIGLKDHKAGKASTHRMEMKLMGANENATVRSEKQTEYTENFFNVASAPEGIKGVRSFERIVLEEVYPGIDWIVYSNDKGIKYDFIVKPGANPALIKMDYAFADGIKLNRDGSLTISCSLGEVTEDAPVCFQGGKEVKGEFVLKGNVVTVDLEGYDATKELVIDPSVVWSTYYGGNSDDRILDITTDQNGFIYSAGTTSSSNSIASLGYDNTYSGPSDAMLIKMSPSGQLIWATYYGGNGSDEGTCVATFGNTIYLGGSTTSPNQIASPQAHQPQNRGGRDGFIAKFSTSGTRIWSTYYGGPGLDMVTEISVSSSGNVFFCGATNSGNTSHNLIATPNSHQTYFAGGEWDGYVVKMNPSGTRLWGTYYGGPEYEFLEDLRVDSDENVIVVGVAFSLTNATYYPSFPFWPGSGSALAVKFPSAGGHPIWNRYVPNCVSLHAVEIDFQNNIIVGGQVNSFNPLNGCLAKLAPSGNVIWTTTYGGPGHDVISSVDSDPLGNIYIAGRTASSSGISFNGFQNFLTPNNNTSNNQDLMVAKFDMSGTQIWGSYFGGPQNEDHPNIHYAGDGIVYLAGMTRSSSAIAAGTNLLQANPGGGQDGFICKISACEVIAQISPNSPISLCPGASVTLSEVSLNNGNVTYLWSNGNTASSIQVNTPGTYTVTVTEASGCSSQATVTVQQPPVSAIAGSNSPLCAESTLNLSASGGVSYNWSGPNGFTSTAQNPTIANVTTTASGTYSVTATATNGCSSTTTTNVVVNPRPVVSVIFPSNSECAGHQAAIHMQGPGPNHTWLWTGPNNLYLASPSIWIPALSNVHSGTYIGTATNTNGCSDTVTMQLNVITVTASNSGPTCPGGTIQLSAGYNGPLGNTAFSWTGPNGFTSNSQNPVINNFDPSMAGIYTVTRNGCSASTTVSAAPNPISLSISGTATSCNSSVDGSADLNITGGISPLNFFWSNGATTEDLSNLPPGNYSVSVTDNVGCIATATVVISAGPPFTPTASNSGNVCPGGTLTFNASIGTTYSWSGPNGFTSSDQNPIISNFPGVAYGTYAVTVTNAAGCIGTDTATVTPTCPAQALTFDGVDDLVNINNTLGNFGTGDFTVELNVRTTRTGEYIIAKRPSCNFGNFWNVFIIGNGKVAIEVGQGPGNFNYTTFTSVSSVVDGQWHHITLSRNGTLISLYIDGVLENSANPSFVANLNNTAVLRLGYSPCTNVNGTLVYQGDMDEIRIWNRALCLGELQNNQNCTLGGMQTALLAQYSFNQGIAFGNNPTETSLMDNSGNGNNGTLQSFGLNGLISNWVAPGVGNGAPCSAFVAPVIVAGSNSPVCGGTDLNLTVTAGTSYQWSGPNGFTSTLQNPTLNNFSAAMVGTYAVTVTSGSGCASTANVTVAGDAVAPTITCPAAITVNCEPGLCGATVSYAMATGSDNCPNLTLVRALGLASGSFFPRGSNFVTFEAIDGAGNASNCEMGIHVLDNQAPVITCPPSFTVNATLGSCDAMVNFALPTATDNCPSPTVVQVSGNPSGATLGIGTYSYAFEAHDISANQGFCNFTVTVADQEAPTAICQNSNLQLVQGSATLSASNIDNGSSDQCGAVTLSLGQSNFDCSHAGNNNVTLTVTDASGNTSSCVAVVNVIPGAMSVTTQVQTYNCGYGISCNGLSDGRAVATPVGGCPPYSYLWDNGETGATATHLDHYNHNVTVTDGNGTVAGATVYVTEPPLLIFSLSSQTYACGHNLHCYGSHDGFIGSSLSGGCAPYTYSWTGPGGFHSSASCICQSRCRVLRRSLDRCEWLLGNRRHYAYRTHAA
jgi:hypothetical protein